MIVYRVIYRINVRIKNIGLFVQYIFIIKISTLKNNILHIVKEKFLIIFYYLALKGLSKFLFFTHK